MKKVFITNKWIIGKATQYMVNLHLVNNFEMYFFNGQTPPSFYMSYSIFDRVWTHHMVEDNVSAFDGLEKLNSIWDFQIKKDYKNTIKIIEENLKRYEDMLPEKELNNNIIVTKKVKI